MKRTLFIILLVLSGAVYAKNYDGSIAVAYALKWASQTPDEIIRSQYCSLME